MSLYSIRWRSASAAMVLILHAIALYSPRSQAFEDDYTRAVRSEGSKLPVLNKPAEAPAASVVDKTAAREAFEADLRSQAPASRRFYDDLDAARRQQVYEYYLKEGRITENVRRFIVKMRLGS